MAGNFWSRIWAALLALAVVGSANAQSLSPTRTRLLSHTFPSAAGAPVTLRADVDGLGSGAPSGAFVTFYDGPTRLGLGRIAVRGAGQDTLATGSHSCALTSVGGLKCWGYNLYGGLGDGTNVNRPAPVDVVGLTSGVIAVAAGELHTCAVTTAGGVKCWGPNFRGGLGDGTTIARRTPVDVVGLTKNVLAVAAGYDFSCALTRWGGVKCWGWNTNGQLGDGTTTSRLTPVNVAGLTSGVVAVAVGTSHACALMRSGGVKCWGFNRLGELGDGTHTDRHRPVDVSGLASGVVAIDAGSANVCALTAAGGVKCWGGNYFGQIGDGTTTFRDTPVDVVGLTSGAVAVSVGAQTTCALTSTGAAKCWGRNQEGTIGDGTTLNRSTPYYVSGLTRGVVAVAAGFGQACALTDAGVVKCWGLNSNGSVGDGTTTSRLTPVTTTNLTALVRGGAYFTTGPLASGLHVMRAFYSGDARHGPSSAGFGQTVQ